MSLVDRSDVHSLVGQRLGSHNPVAFLGAAEDSGKFSTLIVVPDGMTQTVSQVEIL